MFFVFISYTHQKYDIYTLDITVNCVSYNGRFGENII